jgi:hypothetical protein
MTSSPIHLSTGCRYTGKTRIWDSETKLFKDGSFDGDPVTELYEMKQSFEEESFTQWWCLGRPDVGTITSSRLVTPESTREVVRFDDETEHGIDREEREVGNADMLSWNQVRNLGMRVTKSTTVSHTMI